MKATKKEGDAWKKKIVKALGPKVGNGSDRKAFADELIKQLSAVSPEAGRNKQRQKLLSSLKDTAEKTINGVNELQRLIEAGGPYTQKKASIVAHRYQSQNKKAPDLKLVASYIGHLKEIIIAGAGKIDSRSAEELIAEFIAGLYLNHFQKKPGVTKGNATPYQKVCEIVGAIHLRYARRYRMKHLQYHHMRRAITKVAPFARGPKPYYYPFQLP